MVEDIEDPRRREPEFLLGEREMLERWLEFHRMTLLLKCERLDYAGRKARPVAARTIATCWAASVDERGGQKQARRSAASLSRTGS
jgi:hypothetical protein